MKTYIFYTGEGKTLSPNDSVCENFQILGFEKGESEKKAIENLLKRNVWISGCGFSENKIIYRQVL